MRLFGILSYWDESAAWLSACVASLARCCDHVVACDGRYGLFDADHCVSPPEQTEAIIETAAGAGLPLTLHVPSEPFYSGEIGKRNLTLKLAAAHAEPMVDWVFICDADCYVTECSDHLKHDLERTDHHCASVLVEEHMDANDPRFEMKIANDHSMPSSWRSPVTLLYRMLPNLAYHGTHYSLAGDVDGKRTWLWGHDSAVVPADLRQGIVIRHRNTERPLRRQEQAATYYSRRDKLGLEARPLG